MRSGEVAMGIQERACQRCRARLRRDQRGDLCDPCTRRGQPPGELLAPEFFADELIRAALASYDFATLLRRVRAYTGLSQQQLGDLVDLDQPRISSIERGEHRLRDIAIVARLATGLGIPPALLGFGSAAATVDNASAANDREVSWVDRRDFVQTVTGLTLGLVGAAGLDIDRLDALLSHPDDPAVTRRVGAADIEAIEQATAAFRRWDFTYGGGLSRNAAVAQLRSTLPLLNAEVTPEVRSRLLVATADLAMQAAWMSYDVEQHDAARRIWLVGLDLARDAEDPRATDLTVYLLLDMAHQARHLHRPDETRRLVQLGYATAASSPHPISASATSALASNQAWVHAARGDAAACERALGQAVEQSTTVGPASAAPWAAYVSGADLAAWQSHAHYMLALAEHDPRAAGRAVALLRHAVDHYGPDYARSRAVNLPELAGAHALAGDTDTAVTVGHQAVDAISALSSPRAHSRLRTLDTVLRPLHATVGVAELRSRLGATAA